MQIDVGHLLQFTINQFPIIYTELYGYVSTCNVFQVFPINQARVKMENLCKTIKTVWRESRKYMYEINVINWVTTLTSILLYILSDTLIIDVIDDVNLLFGVLLCPEYYHLQYIAGRDNTSFKMDFVLIIACIYSRKRIHNKVTFF